MKCIICDQCGKTIEKDTKVLNGYIQLVSIENDLSLSNVGTFIIDVDQHFCSGGECLMKRIVEGIERMEGSVNV